jgi:hypothetical protein
LQQTEYDLLPEDYAIWLWVYSRWARNGALYGMSQASDQCDAEVMFRLAQLARITQRRAVSSLLDAALGPRDVLAVLPL